MMHSDAPDQEHAESVDKWQRYIELLRASGSFEGGSSMGDGALYKKGLTAVRVNGGISGFLRVRASGLEEASRFLDGNPVFEAGGTVEVRALLKD